MKNIQNLQDALAVKDFGGKAVNLSIMMRAGLPVPSGLAVGLDAFGENGKLTKQAIGDISDFLDDRKLYAVRSSAVAEDSEGESWAGQFETFLNTNPNDVIAKIEQCHNSAKDRARAYAGGKTGGGDFRVAVVVQEMLEPEYAGVVFTQDPVTSADQIVVEYVEGLGEALVSGRADPKRIVIDASTEHNIEFDYLQLADLARKTEKLFGVPQDIEWAWVDDRIWLLQARPITAIDIKSTGYDLGRPEDLFYWGPSRARPMYMSDFMAAIERLFVEMARSPELPTPPRTLVLFAEEKMVWLNNAAEFSEFTEKTFEIYEKQNRLEQDITAWKTTRDILPELEGRELAEGLINAWYLTEFAEFALYGSRTILIKRLKRFDDKARQEIWATFTMPDKSIFSNRVDSELIMSRDPAVLASKYPWIKDGYSGVYNNAVEYFTQRLERLGDGVPVRRLQNPDAIRQIRSKELGLTDGEVQALAMVRKLAEFMDDRKAWMMQTRRLLKKSVGTIEHGWFFTEGTPTHIGKRATHELWLRYVDFKTSASAITGIVASNGGRHFINGEIVIVANPTDAVKDDCVIVVPSTSPTYVPLMRKARALITDHGGMMSHAAIVAREFGLPCIVGTKQATKVLKTGDSVVLDLVRGEVIR